jgi:hypothetical protein
MPSLKGKLLEEEKALKRAASKRNTMIRCT